MGLKAAKCSQCGANLEIKAHKDTICPNCGTKYIEEKSINQNITNIDKQVNINIGESSRFNEQNHCQLILKALEKRDFYTANAISLEVLANNPENSLANMVYSCDFHFEEEYDYDYSAPYFNLDSLTNYFLENMGEVDLDFCSLVISLIKEGYPNYNGLEVCLETIFKNVNLLDCKNNEFIEFFMEAKSFHKPLHTLDILQTKLSSYRGAGLLTFLLTDNEYIAADVDEERDELKRIVKELKQYINFVYNIILNEYKSTSRISQEIKDQISETDKQRKKQEKSTQGCYIATCIYGSYNCPEVWVLRRYRDYKLNKSFIGKLFIKIYYKFSPSVVKIFGNKKWFRNFWKNKLDKKVNKLKSLGYCDFPYSDKKF